MKIKKWFPSSRKKGVNALVLCSSMLIVSALVFFSCKKQTESRIAKSKFARTFNYQDWPTVQNGMLAFRDTTQLLNYTQFLDSAMVVLQSDGTVDSSADEPDLILEGIEQQLGFVSLRHITQANFDQLNEVGWDNIEDIPQKHFLNSITQKSILNANADVQIGDLVVHYISANYAVALDASNQGLLDKMHTLDANATMPDIDALDPDLELNQIYYLPGVLLSGATRTTGVSYSIGSNAIYMPNVCLWPNRVRVDAIRMWTTGYNKLTADITIDWGDGHSETHPTTSANLVLYGIDHTYSQAGNYTVVISGKSTQSGYISNNAVDAQVSQNISLPMGCYAEMSRDWDVWVYPTSGIAYECHAWVQNYLTLVLNSTQHKVGASTTSYYWKNGKWKTSRIDHVSAVYSTTDYSTDCSNHWGDAGTSFPANTTSAQAEHTNPGHIGWFSLHTSHQIIIGSSVFTYDHDLTPCP